MKTAMRSRWGRVARTVIILISLLVYYNGCSLPTKSDTHRILLANKHNDFQHLRILAFGTSRTHGVGVASPHKAFPSLLSRNNTKNLAMKASGPHYSALCTQTMVGVELYDVILFEYNLMADDYIIILARRLRERFPQATMIFMLIWLPFQFLHVPSNKAVLPLIREKFGASASNTPAPDLLESILEGTQPSEWVFQEATDKKNLITRVAAEVGGFVYHMPRPENSVEALKTHGRYYTSDMNHFTQAGHRFLQQELVKVLHEVNAEPTSQLGKWKEMDVCHLWYETGKVAGTHNAPTVSFLNGRFALEFPTPESYMETRNPFPGRSISVWIDFIAGSPAGQYPKSQILLSPSGPVEIDPRLRGKGELHVMKHAYVGMLEPSASRNLTVKVLDSKSSNHFRIVGVAYSTIHVEEGQEII